MSKTRLLGPPNVGAHLVLRRSPRVAMSGHIAVPNHANPMIHYLRIGIGRCQTWNANVKRATMLSVEDAVAWALVLTDLQQESGSRIWTMSYTVIPARRKDAGDTRRWERPRPNAPPADLINSA